MKELYKYSLDEAKEFGSLDVLDYNESYNENVRCKNAVEKAINELSGNSKSEILAVKKVIAEFGYDRTMWVLAASAKMQDNNTISSKTQNWAYRIIPEHFDKSDFCGYAAKVDSPALEKFIGIVRSEDAKLGLLDETYCIDSDQFTSYKNKLVVLNPNVFREECRSQYLQYFYVTSETESLATGDRMVLGRFLADSIDTVNEFARSECLGIADEAKLPDWARKRLEVYEKTFGNCKKADTSSENVSDELLDLTEEQNNTRK